MKNLKIKYKLLIICLAFAIPVFLFIYMFLNEQMKNMKIINQELAGVTYIDGLMEVLVNLQQEKALISGVNTSSTGSRPPLTTKVVAIDSAFNKLEQIDATLGKDLKTESKLTTLKNQWQGMKGRDFAANVSESLDLHNRLIADTIALIAGIADSSGLILDPELDSYYLMDITTSRIPDMLDTLNQTQALGAGVAIKKAITEPEKIQIAIMLSKVKSSLENISRGLDVAYSKNVVVKPQVGYIAQSTNDGIAKSLAVVEKELINNPTIAISPEDYTANINGASLSGLNLYYKASATLADILNTRGNNLYHTTLVTVILGAIGLFIATGIVILMIRNVNSSIKQVLGVVNNMAKGEITDEIGETSKDEIGQLLHSLKETLMYLKEMGQVADQIAQGNVSVKVQPRSPKDLFGNAFQHMVENLQQIANTANAISTGDLSVKVIPHSATDTFGNSFKKMVDNFIEMAQIADSIAAGNLSVKVKPQSSADVFGNAFKQMVDNLRQMAQVADSIAAGDLSVKVVPQSTQDMFGNSFKHMVENFRQMAQVTDSIAAGDLSVRVEPQSASDVFGNALKRMLESLRSIIRDLAEGSQNLSASANELVAVTTQQSSTVAEQASSIQEISTTLEQIRAIVEQANERAKSVVHVADQSLDISMSGQQDLENVADAMNKIRDQVEAIAENILDLSEKTIQIGEITSSVNDIAEQSNLLAVNAAIEATKAGEAGKGFGVVAVEVKNLAARSKKATSQVRSILAEIQKAANSTVMVTEEGSKKVDMGVNQVYRIGANIKSLHEVIVESSSSARQISSATNQQVTGIEQIALAMKHISQGANETVASAKQQRITAQDLSLLATNLNNIVQRYSL